MPHCVGTFRHQFAKYQFVAYIINRVHIRVYICMHVYAVYSFLVYTQF